MLLGIDLPPFDIDATDEKESHLWAAWHQLRSFQGRPDGFSTKQKLGVRGLALSRPWTHLVEVGLPMFTRQMDLDRRSAMLQLRAARFKSCKFIALQ